MSARKKISFVPIFIILSLAPSAYSGESVNTQALEMTGLRFKPLTVDTQALEMTGLRFKPLVMDTQALEMTGLRFKPLVVDTQALEMTGLRFKPLNIHTQALQMTGMRGKPSSFRGIKPTALKQKAVEREAAPESPIAPQRSRRMFESETFEESESEPEIR